MTMKVVGAGLGRTGTTSLKAALEKLGFGPCHHMSEVLAGPHMIPLWLDAADGRPEWDRIFAGYQATLDYPGCMLWREVADHYPDARIILTVRDPDRWFESVNETIFSDAWVAATRGSPAGAFFERLVYADFGDRITDRAFMTDYFRRWNDRVTATVPADRLLTYEVAEGWEPLCAFLGVAVPDVPFPRINTREEMAGMLAHVTAQPPTAEEMLDMAKGFIQRIRI